MEKNDTKGKKEDSWDNIMNDLYKLGKDTNDTKIIEQAILGARILNEQKLVKKWMQNIKYSV